MTPIAVAGIAFVLMRGGAILGIVLRARLPEHHLTGDSKEVIRLSTALIASLTALVLALLFSATRASFEHTSGAVSRLAADITELDEILDEYGPEALPIRKQLRNGIGPLVDSIWRQDAIAAGRQVPARTSHSGSALYMVRELQPKTPVQASLQAHALQIGADMLQTRLLLFARPPDSVSMPFMTVMILWLGIIFTTFSMSSKPNATLNIVLGVCTLSAAGAIYLILELGLPFGGLMEVSYNTLRGALPPL